MLLCTFDKLKGKVHKKNNIALIFPLAYCLATARIANLKSNWIVGNVGTSGVKYMK